MKKIYVLHGWTYDLSKWEKVIKELKSRGIEPIMLNVPGLTSKSEKVWGINDYVDWLHEKLAGNSPVTLLGHSNGGRIALNFVNKYPSMVKSLFLVDSAGIYDRRLKTVLKRYVFGALSKIGKGLSKSTKLKKVFYRVVREHDYENAPENMRRTMLNMIESDKTLNITKINIPTYIIWGSQDRTTPVSDAKKLHKQIPNSSLDFIRKSHHSPFFSNPSAFADIVEGIINSESNL